MIDPIEVDALWLAKHEAYVIEMALDYLDEIITNKESEYVSDIVHWHVKQFIERFL